MEEEPPSPKSEFMMAIAGPLASFLLAYIFSSVEKIGLARGWPTPVVGVSNALAYINMVVAVFNLVPAFPLDGGRMLRAALWHFRKDARSATRIAGQMGSAFGLFLMVLGVIAFLQGNFVGGMWWFLIGIFMRGIAAASYQRMVLHEMLHHRPISEFMRQDPVTVPPTISIREFVEDHVYRHHFKMFPVTDDDNLIGCVTLDGIRDVPRDQWDRQTVRDIMEATSAANTVSADMETEKLLTEMMRPGQAKRFMVVDGEKLVGVIALKDVLELVALKMEIEPSE